MSLPKFPAASPSLSRGEALNQIISSIAMEEVAISHIINAEGEKLQYVFSGAPGLSGPATIDEVLQVNKSVHAVLQNARDNQSLLNSKLQYALSAAVMAGQAGSTGAVGQRGKTGAAGAMGETGPSGPSGATGCTGANGASTSILGVFDTLTDLQATYPTGATGDSYMVVAGNTLYVWSPNTGASGTWMSAGNIQGPTGPDGPTGTFKGGNLFSVNSPNGAAKINLGDKLEFRSANLDITVSPNPTTVNIKNHSAIYTANLTSSSSVINIPLKNVTYRVQGGANLSLYVVTTEPIRVDIRRFGQYDLLWGSVDSAEWDNYTLSGTLKIDDVYNSSNEKNTAWIRQRDPDTHYWTLHEINLFSSNRGARTTIWVNEIETGVGYN